MNNFKRETITYASTDRNGKDTSYNVTYTLYFDDNNQLIEVRNQAGFAIEKTGEVWEYFDGKYNNL